MGLLTEDESKFDRVVGWLSAEDVFKRIKKYLGGENANDNRSDH